MLGRFFYCLVVLDIENFSVPCGWRRCIKHELENVDVMNLAELVVTCASVLDFLFSIASTIWVLWRLLRAFTPKIARNFGFDFKWKILRIITSTNYFSKTAQRVLAPGESTACMPCYVTRVIAQRAPIKTDSKRFFVSIAVVIKTSSSSW